MVKIKIISHDNIQVIESDKGISLLNILRNNGYNIYAPCGGKGTCGKCTVKVAGEGEVISCNYFPEKNVEAILPRDDEANILVHQTEYLEDLPFSVGHTQYYSSNPYGVAIDIGTTTLVFYFVSLITGRIEKISSELNNQMRYGADIISRINYCQENETGLTELQNSVVGVINKELDVFRKRKENLDPANFVRVVIAGNTTMFHLLLGEDPVSIALAPFKPKFLEKQIKKGGSTGLKINPEAELITLPCLAAFVGADILAGLSALKSLYRNYLFLDIGTNGEIALVKDGAILKCATAAGPAFEGTNISRGMAAVHGAISGFSGPDNYQVIGSGKPSGICGSGIVDIVAYLLRTGLIDETGLLKETFVISSENEIEVTQQDIREIQLAKSAIEIGLLPTEMKDRIYPVGNSAGIGALQYLKSYKFEDRINQTLKNSLYVELSNFDEFSTEFALNMDFIKHTYE